MNVSVFIKRFRPGFIKLLKRPHMSDHLTTATGAGQRCRVLIAEDYVLIQENIRRALPAQVEVVGAVEDGSSALEAITAKSPDILLLDVSLPDMTGFEVAEHLMKAGSSVRIIFLTAYADRMYADRALEIGAKGYVLKGRMWTELPRAIEEVISGRTYRSPLVA